MRGTIYQRKSDNKWVGSVDLGKDVYGKRKRKTVYGNLKSEVEEKINTIIYEIQTGEYIEPSKESFINFLYEYHRVCRNKWADTTASLYKMYIDVHFKPYFNDMKLVDIKPITLNKFYSYKLDNVEGKKIPLTNNTIIKLNKFLNSAFNYAVKNEMIKTNPASNVILAKKEKYKPNVYNEKLFLQLLDYVKDKYDRVPITLGAGMGFRRGEIFGLTWNDIDFENKLISVNKTKVRFDKNINKSTKNESSNRIVSGPDYVFETLKDYKKEMNPKSDDENILNVNPSYYSHRFKWLLDKFDMPAIRLHDLRHFNAVMMMEKGIPDKVAAERLGHSQVSTLRDIYQHVLTDVDRNAADKLNDIFSKM